MADDRQDVRNQQSGSGSQRQPGTNNPTHGSSDRDTSRKQGEQGRENQTGQQTPKVVQNTKKDRKNQGTQKTGTRYPPSPLLERRPPWRVTSRLTVDAARSRPMAISRIDEPAAMPREISSRSAKLSARRERARATGAIPPRGTNKQ